jgi:protein subunit release factor B
LESLIKKKIKQMGKIIKLPKNIAEQIIRKRNQFKVDTFRAGGCGGQNQNKVESGVRITDLVTGLSAEGRDQRMKLNERLLLCSNPASRPYGEEGLNILFVELSDEAERLEAELAAHREFVRQITEGLPFPDAIQRNGYGRTVVSVEDAARQLAVKYPIGEKE